MPGTGSKHLGFRRGNTPGTLQLRVCGNSYKSIVLVVSRLFFLTVGGKYSTGLLNNFLTDGTTAVAITKMKNLFILANSKCPSAKIVAGGYRYAFPLFLFSHLPTYLFGKP